MVVGLIVFGIVAGLLSGMLGIGGGLVLVPGLMILFGFTQLEAQGTSLAVLSIPICLLAASIYYHNGHMRLSAVAVIAMGFIVGSVIGAKVSPLVPITILRFVFGAALTAGGLLFIYHSYGARIVATTTACLCALGLSYARAQSPKHLPATRSLNKHSDHCDYYI